MAETLILRLAENGQEIRDWLLAGEQDHGDSVVQAGAPDSGILSTVRRVVVLVPSAAVLISSVRVPGRNRQKILKAVPYALEEKLASDVEDLHFALGSAGEESEYPVVVVEKTTMDLWNSTLRDQGIHASQLIPDVLTLPLVEGETSLLVDGDVTLVRNNEYAGFAADNETARMLMTLRDENENDEGDEDESPQALTVYGTTSLELDDFEVNAVDQDLSPLQVCALGFSQGKNIDLLQGAYSHREEWGRYLRPWKISAALLLAALILAGGSLGLNQQRLQVEKEQLTADIETLYRKTFPKAKRIVNPRVQMEQKLRQLEGQANSGDTGFLVLLTETGKVLRSTRGILLQGVSFRDGRLDLELKADDLQILDKLKQSLVSSGSLIADIQSAVTEKDRKIKSRIRIKGTDS